MSQISAHFTHALDADGVQWLQGRESVNRKIIANLFYNLSSAAILFSQTLRQTAFFSMVS